MTIPLPNFKLNLNWISHLSLRNLLLGILSRKGIFFPGAFESGMATGDSDIEQHLESAMIIQQPQKIFRNRNDRAFSFSTNQ
jgi:hypothetical protein